VIAGSNYGQGSSREQAAVAPRSLKLRMVAAKSFARIHRQNLINYGVLPLVFADLAAYDRLRNGDVLIGRDLHRALAGGREITLECGGRISTRHDLARKQIAIVLAGGLINWCQRKQ
jgi:aconitate hydratase